MQSTGFKYSSYAAIHRNCDSTKYITDMSRSIAPAVLCLETVIYTLCSIHVSKYIAPAVLYNCTVIAKVLRVLITVDIGPRANVYSDPISNTS